MSESAYREALIALLLAVDEDVDMVGARKQARSVLEHGALTRVETVYAALRAIELIAYEALHGNRAALNGALREIADIGHSIQEGVSAAGRRT